jgi:hypothetical protein
VSLSGIPGMGDDAADQDQGCGDVVIEVHEHSGIGLFSLLGAAAVALAGYLVGRHS